MEVEYVRGHLATMILAVLRDGPAHGYRIGAELKLRSNDRLEVLEGSLYPALHRLEEVGCVESEWEMSEGRRRRSYSLTAAGMDELTARSAKWTEFRLFMDSLVKDSDV